MNRIKEVKHLVTKVMIGIKVLLYKAKESYYFIFNIYIILKIVL